MNILIIPYMIVVFFPIYMWESGMPQISDIIFIIGFISYFSSNRIKVTNNIKILFLFVFSVIIRNLIASITYSDTEFLKNSLYYLYNFLFFIYWFQIIIDNRSNIHFFRKLFYSVFISQIVVLIFVVLEGIDPIIRNVASFNNPNQLAVFGLLSSVLVQVLNELVDLEIHERYLTVNILLGYFLVMVSLSNAGIIAYTVFVIFHFLSSNNSFYKKIFLVLFFLLVIYIFDRMSGNILFEKVVQRMSKTSEKISVSGEMRGYSRFLMYPESLLIGIGEGYYLRFGGTHEFHSTIGNILLSYGIFPLFLFLLFRWNQIKGKKEFLILTIPIFLYGLSHNGIRFSLVWIIYACMESYEFKPNPLSDEGNRES